MSAQAHKNAWLRSTRCTTSTKSTIANLERELAELRSRLAQLERDSVEADTIPEFCRRWNISRSTYYALKHLGQAPREMRPGPDGKGPILISRAAQAEWRKKQEQRAGALEAAE